MSRKYHMIVLGLIIKCSHLIKRCLKTLHRTNYAETLQTVCTSQCALVNLIMWTKYTTLKMPVSKISVKTDFRNKHIRHDNGYAKITIATECLRSRLLCSGGFEGGRGGTAPIVKSLASLCPPVILYSTTYNVGQRY